MNDKVTAKFLSQYKSSSQDCLDAALSMACEEGDLDRVAFLLSSKQLKRHANKHAAGSIGFIMACAMGHTGVAKYILESKDIADKNDLPGACLNGAIANACQNEKWQTVNFLIKNTFVQQNINIDYVLSVVCKYGNASAAKYLLALDEQFWKKRDSKTVSYLGKIIDYASRNGNLKIVKLLLGSSIFTARFTDFGRMFCIACMAGHFNVAKYIFKTQLYTQPNTANMFGWCCANEQVQMLEYILKFVKTERMDDKDDIRDMIIYGFTRAINVKDHSMIDYLKQRHSQLIFDNFKRILVDNNAGLSAIYEDLDSKLNINPARKKLDRVLAKPAGTGLGKVGVTDSGIAEARRFKI